MAKKLSADDPFNWCYTPEKEWGILHEEALHQETIRIYVTCQQLS